MGSGDLLTGRPDDLKSKISPLIHGKPGQVTLIKLINADQRDTLWSAAALGYEDCGRIIDNICP